VTVVGTSVLLMVFLVVSVAQFMPSCEGTSRPLVGWVEDKFYHGRRSAYVVVINNVEHNVPDDFYDMVEIGDLVKREGGVWSIVRKKGS